MTIDAMSPERPSLVVERLGIQRMEGISQSFEIDGLVSGINVIHGPNAIGKSRTTIAIQALIWPDRPGSRREIFGEFSLSGTTWRVETDHFGAIYQRNGAPVANPSLGFAPAIEHDRYLLTLHDLLRADNKHFAKIIEQESQDGYDLNAARADAGIPPKEPKPSRTKEVRAYEAATAQTKSLRRNEQSLQVRERARGDLTLELDVANAALARIRLLEAAREHAVAVSDLKAAEIAREAFLDPIGHMNGDEFERIEAHAKRLAALDEQLVILNAETVRHEQALATTGFSGEIPTNALFTRLNSQLSSVIGNDSEIESLDLSLAASRIQLQHARNRIAAGITNDQLRELDSNGLREIGDLTRRFREAAHNERSEAVLAAWVGGVKAPTNLVELRRGVDLLATRLCLGEPDTISPRENVLKWALIGAALVLLIEAVLLAVLSHPAWLALVLLALPLIGLALRRERSNTAEVAARIEREFSSLGFDAPPEWTPEGIDPIFETLHTHLAAATLDEQRAIKWGDLANRRQDLTREREAIETTRQTQIDTLGVTTGSDEPESIRQIADSIDAWRKATAEVLTAEARISTVRLRRETLLAELNSVLETYRASEASEALDHLDADAQIEALQRRVDMATQADNELRSCRQKLAEQVQPAIDREQAAIAAIYAPLEFEAHDAMKLRELCDRVEACKQAQTALDNARVVEQTKRLPLSDDHELAERGVAEIEAERAEADSRANERDDIFSRIAGLDHVLRHAREQTSLEEAIALEAQALDDLFASRNREFANATAWQLAEFVQLKTRDLNRPHVFHAARDLFSQFTAGAWRLELGDGSDPMFHAVETSSGRGHTLDQLSSGTRVQLLMAVRVAFLEVSEQGPQLPLILDEALGNADDIRANAIIDATIEIARRGRQVFYFTAQRDEIGKWHARIEQTSNAPELASIDLAEVRGIANAEHSSGLTWNRTQVEPVALPEGTTHQAARALLHVATFDLWSEHLDGVDLWYLITDLPALTTLRQSGITTCGQYRQLREHGGLRILDSFDQIDARCEARLLVIDAVRRNWQRGRPKPLNRELLLGSGAVSARFTNRVTSLAKSLDWNAGGLIQALVAKTIPRFSQDAIQELDDYFRANGFISDSEPINDEALRLVARSAIQASVAPGVLETAEIDLLLQNLASHGPVAPTNEVS